MKPGYRKTATTLSSINYHLVFCPRYRRKIFLIDGVDRRFKDLINQICEQNAYELISVECASDCCHIYVNVPPSASPRDVIKIIKGATSDALRNEFKPLSKMPSLWTRCYFATTESEMPQSLVDDFVKSQKTRYK